MGAALDPAQFTGAGVEQPEHGAQVGASLQSGARAARQLKAVERLWAAGGDDA